jgi:hypothetical protein
MAACLKELDAADEEEDALCNAVACDPTTVVCLDPPN